MAGYQQGQTSLVQPWQPGAVPTAAVGGSQAPSDVTAAWWSALWEDPKWPLGSFLALGAIPESVPTARGHALAVAAEWGLARLSDDLTLVVSELFTNALRESVKLPTRPPVRLRLRSDRSRIQVLVWDAGPNLPEEKTPAPDDLGGRGLTIVASLSQGQWGWTTERAGKTCWAILS
jgi:anti-sigma regulatory factor (Ser/Thr protein kinase)